MIRPFRVKPREEIVRVVDPADVAERFRKFGGKNRHKTGFGSHHTQFLPFCVFGLGRLSTAPRGYRKPYSS